MTRSTTLALGTATAMMLAAGAGLVFTAWRYPTEALRAAFVPNDIVTLIVGVPLLLAVTWAAARDRGLGRLLLPGALLYGVYNAIATAVGLALGIWSLPDLAVLALGVPAAVILVRSESRKPVERRQTLMRAIAGILIGLGGLFLIRALMQLSGATALTAPELGVCVADLVITPLWIIGGVALWQDRPFGVALGIGLFFQANLLFVGLLAVLALQPLVAGQPFVVTDFVVILVMGSVCFVPFGWLVATGAGRPPTADLPGDLSS